LFTFAAIAALVFAGLKFTFWANAVILLSLMQRRITKAFWRFTRAESLLAIISAFSVAFLITYDSQLPAYGRYRLAASLAFSFATITYLFYMARRVWKTSEQMEGR
jgi:hypothetical protein